MKIFPGNFEKILSITNFFLMPFTSRTNPVRYRVLSHRTNLRAVEIHLCWLFRKIVVYKYSMHKAYVFPFFLCPLKKGIAGFILLTFLLVLVPFPVEGKTEGTKALQAPNSHKGESFPLSHSTPFHHCAKCCIAHHHDITHRPQFFMPFFWNPSNDFLIIPSSLPDILLISPIYRPPKIIRS